MKFHRLEVLSNEDLRGVLGQVYGDLEDELEQYGEPPDDGITACVQLGRRERQVDLAGSERAEVARRKPLTVEGFGMQVHAATTVDGGDRAALERICRYLMRPPFAQDAIEALDDERVRVHFKAPTRTGRRYTDISRDTFLARLAALVPPPRFNLVRYYGVFASQHKLRKAVAPKVKQEGVRQLKLFEMSCSLDAEGLEAFRFVKQKGCEQEAKAPSRIAWAKLLARVFEIDVTRCSGCGGRLVLLEMVGSFERLRELEGARGPPKPRPSVGGQLSLPFA